jgi:hypothetical protein
MQHAVLRALFHLGLSLNASLTRLRWLRPLEQRLTTPFFVALTRRIRGAPKQAVVDLPAIGREWERLLGSRSAARVVQLDPTTHTVHGEIHVHCPLRGTGDVHACHRLMEYDRRLMAPHGVRFVVLHSQAEVGRSHCTIAMRPTQLDASDLLPAHERSATLTAV